MPFSQSDKKEIEKIVKSEIKSFFNSSTLKQFENQMIDLIRKEIRNGKIKGDITDYITKAFIEFYYEMYKQKHMWTNTFKNLKI